MNTIRFGAFQVVTVPDAKKPGWRAWLGQSETPQATARLDQYERTLQEQFVSHRLGSGFPNSRLVVTGQEDIAKLDAELREVIRYPMPGEELSPQLFLYSQLNSYARKALGKSSPVQDEVELVRLSLKA